MHNKNASSNSTYRKGELEVCLQTAMVLTKVITCNITNKICELQQCTQKLAFEIVAYKICHLLLLHTKAIAALTQFCDFCSLPTSSTFYHYSYSDWDWASFHPSAWDMHLIY